MKSFLSVVLILVRKFHISQHFPRLLVTSRALRFFPKEVLHIVTRKSVCGKDLRFKIDMSQNYQLSNPFHSANECSHKKYLVSDTSHG